MVGWTSTTPLSQISPITMHNMFTNGTSKQWAINIINHIYHMHNKSMTLSKTSQAASIHGN